MSSTPYACMMHENDVFLHLPLKGGGRRASAGRGSGMSPDMPEKADACVVFGSFVVADPLPGPPPCRGREQANALSGFLHARLSSRKEAP